MKNLCSFIIRSCRFFLSAMHSKLNQFSINPNERTPFLPVKEHTFVSYFLNRFSTSIHRILRRCATSEVFSPIVESVSVFMISNFSFFTLKNKSVHKNMLSSPRFASGIKPLVSFVEMRLPIPLRQPFEVGSIDYCVFPSREWNKTVRWVRRLGHCVSSHAIEFSHVLTSSKGLLLSRFIMVALFGLLFSSAAFCQNTTVTAQVSDPTGRFYTFSTGYASLVCPGNAAPTFNGYTVPRTFTIVGFDGNGKFTQTLYDVASILPAGCGYQWHIVWSDGVTAFITGTITSVTGASVDESSAISAFAVPLPNTSGTVLGVTATAPISSSMGVSPVISCPTCTTSAAALTLNALLLGAGGQGESALGSLGTTTTLLHGNAAGAPTFGAVNLATDVTGQLPIAAVGSAGLSAVSPMNIAATGAISLTGQVPIGQVGSAGLSGTAPIVVASTGAISCPTCNTGGTGAITAIDRVTQSAAITSTTLVACPASPAGGTNFLLSSVAKTTTAASSTSTLGPLSVTYTTPDGTTLTNMGIPYRIAPAGTAINVAGDTGNVSTDFDSGVPLLIDCQAGSTVTFAFGYASTGGTAMVYDLHIRLVQQ